MSNNSDVDLKAELMGEHIKKLQALFPVLEDLSDTANSVRKYVMDQLVKFSLSIKTSKLDKDELNSFFDYPYIISKEKHDKENEWHVAVPKFITGLNLGWLDRVTPSFNVFLVNRFSEWFGELPKMLKQELKMVDPLDLYLTPDKKYLTGKDIDKAQEKFGRFLGKRDGDKIEVDQTKYFQLLANLIDDGILPFTPAPIPPEDIIENQCKFELLDYQKEAWEKLKQFGNIGVYYPPSTGKTFIGMQAIGNIRQKGKRWIVVVPRTTLIEQWRENIESWTNIPSQDVVICTYQTAIKKFLDEEFTGLIIDESHHMPADYFVHLSQIKRAYTVGLTATPQREDGREDYIVALTGQPVGLSWDYFRKFGIIQYPESHIWIVKNDDERMAKLKTIVNSDDKVTLIFSTYLKMGEEIKKELGCEFVHGQTKDKLQKIKDEILNNRICAVSGVANEGVSLKTIQRVIEMSWQFGSRHEELQRMTRVLHAADKKNPGIHHVIMTPEEWNRDHKRFWTSMDHGFKIVLHREGQDEKIFQSGHERPGKASKPKQKRYSHKIDSGNGDMAQKINDKVYQIDDFEAKHPVLSMPGIQKKLSACSKAERLSTRIFYQFPDKVFTKEEIWNRVGIGRVRDFASFDKLIELKLIKKVGPTTYQAA